MGDVELNDDADDEDMEDGETGSDDGSAQVRNFVTQANRLSRSTKSTLPYIDHADNGASSV